MATFFVRTPISFSAIFICLVLSPAAFAEDRNFGADVPEPGSIEKIAEYTTDAKYLPESVAYIPDSKTVSSPTEFLGHVVGAPKELTRSAKIHNYFRQLASESPRVIIKKIGTTEEGRDLLVAMVSSEDNLKNLKRYRDITSKLADPRRTPKEEVESLVTNGKMFYYLLGGLHSTETGSPEMLMELAYRLAVSETKKIQSIRENVIVLITPVSEPDGRDRVVDWYYRNLRDRDLPYSELRKFRSPPYWGQYAYHDNNRDGMQLTLELTRAIHSTYYEYHPQVVHDLHESLPLLYISTGHGPYSDAVDPVTINEWTQFAHHEAAALQAQGLPGVWTWGFWDGWWPGYLFSVANNHNSVGRFYETFGNSLAGTFERDLEERKFVGKPVTEEQWYRPWPPDKKVIWSLRNNTNYMQAGVLEALSLAATQRELFLKNFWVKSNRAISKGQSVAPYAFVFPEKQRDPNRLAYLVNLLQQHHYEVHQLRRQREFDGTLYPEGSYVVRLDQPYRNAILNFLEKQEFPKNEPNAPYDDVAWTWPLLFGVEGQAIEDKTVLEAPMDLVRDKVAYPGSVEGQGRYFVLRDSGQNAFLTARVKLGTKVRVEAAESAFELAGQTYPAGSWIMSGSEDHIMSVARELGLNLLRVSELPQVSRHRLNFPRLAVLHTWTSTQDCGWVRYTLDQAEIPYDLLSPESVKNGRLKNYDVVLFPNLRGSFKRIVHGIDPSLGPLPYTRTKKFPSHGVPDASPDITGGMGFNGLILVNEFIRNGGVLLAIGGAGRLPVQGGMVRRVSDYSPGSTPGSEIRAKALRPEHPVMYGYEEVTSVFRGNLAMWDVEDEDRNLVVMQFGTKDVLKDKDKENATTESTGTKSEDKKQPFLLSGWVKDEKKLNGKPAILDVPVENGRVILYSFNPLHRYLNHSDFRLVFNAILNWDDMPPTPTTVPAGTH